MPKYDMNLRPIHYASVSGGKDSLFMLNLILHNLDKYPLDMIVNFELEIDWPFAKNVIDYIERESSKLGIKFVRIKPRKSWYDLKDKYKIPTRTSRWCNSDYKLDCKKQLNEWIKSLNCRPLAYIGFCADEQKRFKYDIGDWKNQDVCYPLAEEGITEIEILKWARTVDIFDGWYKSFERQGCMFCPFANKKALAFIKKHYPDKYDYWINEIREWEKNAPENTNYKYYYDRPIDLVDKQIDEKYMHKLEPVKHKKLF